MFTMDAFVDALTLEEVGDDRYRADSLELHHGVVFGGQLLAQSVMAGLAGQDGKAVKTIHTVFARPANAEAPLDDHRRAHAQRAILASSTVTISQGDTLVTRSLVLLSAEEPDVIRHADTPRSVHRARRGRRRTVRGEGAWEILIVDDVDISDPELVGPPELDVWVRFVDAPDDPAIDQALVAYSTDGFLIGTAMRPHAGRRPGPGARDPLDRGAQPHAHVPRALPCGRVAPAAAAELVRRDTAAATAGRHLPPSTGSWPPPSSRTP